MSTKPPTSTRQSSSAAPAPHCKIHPSAVVADKAQLTGPHMIEIGERAVIQPYAKIKAERGDVRVGAYCSAAEKVVIGGGGDAGGDSNVETVLEEGVSVETAAIVESGARVGSWCTVGIAAKVCAGAIVGGHCHVGATCVVEDGQVLEDYTVLFGDGGKKRIDITVRDREDIRAAREKSRKMEMEALRACVADGKAKWMG